MQKAKEQLRNLRLQNYKLELELYAMEAERNIDHQVDPFNFE